MNEKMKDSLPLIILALVCTLVITIGHSLSKDKIAENKRLKQLEMITAVMPAEFDNYIYDDIKPINFTTDSGDEVSTNAYRARLSDAPVGIVFMPIVAKGYNGDIQLSVGIHADGSLSGVQVLSHNETEGLGGEIHQNKSDWLNMFTNQSFATTPEETWAISEEGNQDGVGQFDQISGATITSRGVINAVKNSLKLYEIEQDTLFDD